MNSLDDFEAFLEPQFDAVAFALLLLLATNVVGDLVIDLATPIKKLKFDAKEAEKRMDELAANNSQLLLRNFERVSSAQELLEKELLPLTKRAAKAYERILKELVVPYEDAVKLNLALKRIHATLDLLRASGFFFLFLQQLQDAENLLDVVRHARVLQQVSLALTGDLLLLRIAREHQHLHGRKVAEFSASLAASVTNDLGHHSTFVPGNGELQANILALHVIDNDSLLECLRKSVEKSVQIAVSSLTRSLQSPRSFGQLVLEVKQTLALYVSTLISLLDNCKLAKIEPSMPGSITQEFQNSLPLGIDQYYWDQFSVKFLKNVGATMTRGGPVARNLRTSKASIQKIIQDSVLNPAAALLLQAMDTID